MVEKRINFTPSEFDAVVLEKIQKMHPGIAHTSSGAIRKALEFFWLYHGDSGMSRKEMQELDLHLSKLIAERLEIRYDDSDKTD